MTGIGRQRRPPYDQVATALELGLDEAFDDLANRGSCNEPLAKLEHGTPAACHEAPPPRPLTQDRVNDHRRAEYRAAPERRPAPEQLGRGPWLSLARDADVPDLVLLLVRRIERDLRQR